jgi:hypothetical protein
LIGDDGKSLPRQENLDSFARLIGGMSKLRFSKVTGRFIGISFLAFNFKAELNKSIAVTKESKIVMMIQFMRFIKLNIYPMESLEETAIFLSALGEHYSNSVCLSSPVNTSSISAR